MKSVMLAKAKGMSVGTIRKYGASFYKKTADKGWQRVSTGEGRAAFTKQENKKAKFIPTGQNLIFAFEDLKSPTPLSDLKARKYVIDKGYVKETKDGFKLTNKGTERYLELKRGKKDRRAKKLAKEYTKHEEAIIGVIKQQQEKIDKEKKIEVKKVGEKREFQAWKMTRKELSTTISIKELNNIERKINKEKFNWYEDRPLMDADVRMSDFHREVIKRAISEGKIIPKKVLKDYPDFMETRAKGKIGVKPKKLKLAEKPVKKKAQIKKTPTKINVKTKTQEYIDQIKNISIMNESGKKSYIKLIKEAIRNKDKAMLDQYLKEVKNWVERNKKFQERKMLRKAKYVKRTGSPGSYKYWYKDEKGRIVEKEKPRVGIKKEVKGKKEEKPQDNKKLNAIRSIVNSKQHGKVNGQPLDLQTANLLVTVADNLSDKNKKVFLNMPMTRMISIADKLRKKGAIK